MSKAGVWRLGIPALALSLFCPAAAAGPGDADPAVAAGQKLIEQKLRLVELLVNSQPARGGNPTGNAEAAAQDKRRQLLDRARQAVASGEFDQAGRILDEALIRKTQATGQTAADGSGLGIIAQRARFKNLSEQLASYRGTLMALAKESRQRNDAQLLLVRSDALARDAEALAEAGNTAGANQRLADAYRMVVEGLARIQSGQTITHSLKFDTPEQEFAYEQRRFQSNEMLLKITLDEGQPAGDKLRLVDGFNAEGHRLNDEAQAMARHGDYREAVGAMESASGQLIKALQAMGVPVF